MIDLSGSCVAYWKMNDNADSNVVLDSSGNGHDGNFYDPGGNPYTSYHHRDGKINGSLYFDGVNDYIRIPGAVYNFSGQGNWSVALWAKRQSTGYNYFIGTDGQTGWYIRFSSSGDAFPNQLVMKIDDGVNDEYGPAGLVTDELWHFIVMVVNDAEDKFLGYLDNVKTMSLACGQVGDLADSVYIGRVPNVSGYHKGELDNIMIFDKAINEDEIAFLWNNGVGTENLQSCARPLVSGELANNNLTGKGLLG